MKHIIETVALTREDVIASTESIPERNKYIIDNNPFKVSENEICRIEGRFDNNIAGYLYPFKTKLLINGKTKIVQSGSNYRVDPKYRKRDFGLSIAEEFVALDDIHVLGMVSPQAKPVYEYLGFTFIDMPSFLFVRHTKKILDHHINKFLSRFLSFMLDCALYVLYFVYRLYYSSRYSKYRIVRKDTNDIDYITFENIIFNDTKKYKEYHNSEWLKYILSYKEEDFFRNEYVEIQTKGKTVGFLIFSIRNQGTDGNWKNFRTANLIEWGGVSLNENDLFKLAILAMPKDADALSLSNIDPAVPSGIKLLPRIKDGLVNFTVRCTNALFTDIADWTKWRIRVAGGDNTF